jgi:two-component system nitrate/nitrite response regulator NarL
MDNASLDQAIKVLCVDDDDLVAHIVRITLKEAGGFRWLGQLRDAESLASHALAEPPDVVLLDLCMPGKCPFEAMDELAAACPAARVLMFSGQAGHSLIDRAIEAGASGYVLKDVDGAELVSAIRHVAHGRFVMGAHMMAQSVPSP